jgi:hypothetical protein
LPFAQARFWVSRSPSPASWPACSSAASRASCASTAPPRTRIWRCSVMIPGRPANASSTSPLVCFRPFVVGRPHVAR